MYPPVERGRLKAWIGVGGSPESVVRAAHADLPLMLAIIGGDPKRFKPYVDLHHRAYGYLLEREADRRALAGLCRLDRRKGARGAVARLQDHARPHRQGARLAADGSRRIRERGRRHGSLDVGSPETVARKIAATVKALGLARFQLKYSAGPLPHEKLMKSIELYGTKVVPLVKEMLAEATVRARAGGRRAPNHKEPVCSVAAELLTRPN